MGRSRKQVPAPDTTLIDYCGCCNKKFSPTLRKTRKFVLNVADAEKEVGLTPTTVTNENGEPVPTENKIVDVYTGLEEIFTWKYGQSFAGLIDPKLGLCLTCGLIVAKLYSALKLLENAKVDSSFLNSVVEKALRKDDKGTDTDQDAADEAAAAAEIEVVEYLEEYYPEPDPEEEVARRTRVVDNSSKEFKCPYCNAGFDKNANLTRHLLLTHEVGDREKEFQCGICGKAYYFSYLLKNHELIHGEQRPFVCKLPSCKASFKNKLGLHNHMKFYHRKTRPFKCRFCPKTFKDSRNHRNHEHYVHSIPMGFKPHECQYCGEHFKRLSSLPGHLRKKCKKNPNRVATDVDGVDETFTKQQLQESAAVQTISIIEEHGIVSIPGNQMVVEEEITLGLIH